MSAYEKGKHLSEIRVGIVTFSALILLVLGIAFAGGDKGLLFQNTGAVKARLFDVGGLKKGGSVTMAGMIVGKVTHIGFVRHGEDDFVEVTMEVRSDLRNRIKTDSLPAVRTQGMLGDRYIDISMGSKEAGPLPEGEVLVGKSATDFDVTLRQASEVMRESDSLLEELNDLIKDFKQHPRKYIKFSVF